MTEKRVPPLMRIKNMASMVPPMMLTPNPPKDTDGRREESGRGVRELQGK